MDRLTLALARLAAASLLGGCVQQSKPPTPPFNTDIAPIVWQRCAPCHRPGQMAPFSLLEYRDVASRASKIADATSAHAMPPWLPAGGFGTFDSPRTLSDEQIRLIASWASQGAPEGAVADRKPAPRWPDGWTLGTPDLVVELPQPYILTPGTSDEFRNFVLPLPLASARFVRGMEVRPGNSRVVHHATLGIDATRASRMLDDADPRPGYDGMFSSGAHSPESHALGWTPGMVPRLDSPSIAWRLQPGSDLVVQLHMMRGHLHEPEPVRPSVGFYFSATPPDLESIDFRLGSKTIDIPAGEAAYQVSDSYQLPVDVDVISIYPHAHYLGKDMKVSATLPDGRIEWLLWIKRWDFRWQDQYRYASPVVLPKGTRLTMTYTYDNSRANAANPHNPPVRVRYGPQSIDEMGDLWLRLVPRDRSDAAILARSFVENERRKDIAASEQALREHPDDGISLGLLGGLYVEAGRRDEGMAYLRRALRRLPNDAQIRSNLGLVLRSGGEIEAAIVELSHAAALAPGNEQVQLNLAEALEDRGDFAGAIRHFRAALAINPTAAETHNNLGVALASAGNVTAAASEFKKALGIRPDYTDAQANLAQARTMLRPR